VSANDASYLAADVPMSSVASHASHLHYLYTHGNRHRRAFLHSRRPYLRNRPVTGLSRRVSRTQSERSRRLQLGQRRSRCGDGQDKISGAESASLL